MCVVEETVSTETQVDADSKHDVQVQTTLSVSPDAAALSPPRSPGGGVVVGGQWPPHQQMLQQLLLQRQQQQQRAPGGSGRPPNASPSPRFPFADKPRKGSAPEFPTDFGRTPPCVSATSVGGSAFRPVLTARVGDWSPSRRAQHEPRLPYFEVRDVTADAGGKRFFRPIADDAATPGRTLTNRNDSRQMVEADRAACGNQVPPAERRSDAVVSETSGDAPAAEGNRTTSDKIAEAPTPPVAAAPAPKSHKPPAASAQSRSSATKMRRAYRSKTAELRRHRSPPVPASTAASVASSPGVQRQVPPGHRKSTTADDDEEDALFSSEAGSVALSTSESTRSRTKSDSSATHSLRSSTSHRPTVDAPADCGSSTSLVTVSDRGERRRSGGWPLDRLPAEGARSLRTSPFRQSPGPLIVCKLKSASELLRECDELHRRQRRSRPSSSASSTRPPVTVAGRQTSHRVTDTLVISPTSAAPSVPTSPSARDSELVSDPQTTSTTDTDSIDRTSPITVVTSTSEQNTRITCRTDSKPVETRSQPTVESEKSERRTEDVTVSAEPACSTSTPTADVTDRSGVHLTPSSPVRSRTETADTARESRSKFRDSNWFHVPKFFKTSK